MLILKNIYVKMISDPKWVTQNLRWTPEVTIFFNLCKKIRVNYFICKFGHIF